MLHRPHRCDLFNLNLSPFDRYSGSLILRIIAYHYRAELLHWGGIRGFASSRYSWHDKLVLSASLAWNIITYCGLPYSSVSMRFQLSWPLTFNNLHTNGFPLSLFLISGRICCMCGPLVFACCKATILSNYSCRTFVRSKRCHMSCWCVRSHG